MKLFLAIAVLLAAITLGAWATSDNTVDMALAADVRTLEVRTGDRIRVVGAPIGCRIARMSRFGGRVVVDCRRAGPLAGSFATFFTAREAALAKFESNRAAKLVVVAPHDGEVRRCEAARK